MRTQAYTRILSAVLLTGFSIAGHVKEVDADAGWNDGFESYSVGAFPNPPWVNSGNNQAYVDNTISLYGSNSFKLFGVLGGSWAAIASRQFSVPAPYIIEFNVYNGSETLSGAHPDYGCLGLMTGTDWWSPGRGLITFTGDHRIVVDSDGTDLGSFVSETWYNVKIGYQIVDTNTINLSYWIDGTFKFSKDFPSIPQESSISYVYIASQEGSAWFDNVSITAIPEPATFSLLALGGLLLLRRRKK